MSADLGADFDNVPLEARKSTGTAPVGGFGTEYAGQRARGQRIEA